MIRGSGLFRGASRVMLALVLWSQAAAAQEAMVLKLIVHRPGIVRLDGRELADLTGAAGPQPVPWRHCVLQIMEIPPGRHLLSLKPGDPMALPPWEEQAVEGAAGDTVTAVLGRPVLVTSPPGALVRVAGEPMGPAPVRVNPVLLPGAAVNFELPGYRAVTVTGDSVLAVAREAGSFRLEMAWSGPPPASPSVAADEPRFWWQRHRALALGGSLALLSGGVYSAFRLKDQADERFDAYLRTGNRQRQRELFDEAERLDRLTLVGWGVAEIAFLASFFLLIHQEPRGMVPAAGLAPAAAPGPTGGLARFAGLSPAAGLAPGPAGGAAELRVGVTRAF